MKRTLVFLTALLVIVQLSAQPTVQYKNGSFIYHSDDRGNRLPDYSYCGYSSSELPLPIYPATISVSPVEGDATLLLQQAIETIAQRKPDANGHRGVILLEEGTYLLSGSLRINTSGIVLRGSHPQRTKLVKTGTGREALIYIEGKNDIRYTDTLEVSPRYYPVNTTTLQLTATTQLPQGSRVKIIRTSTAEWIKSIGCDVFGGGNSYLGWKPGDIDLAWDRKLVQSATGSLQLHAPLTMALDPTTSTTHVYAYEWPGRIQQSGIEQMTLASEFNPELPTDEDHSWTGIYVDNAEDCWIRKVSLHHFAGFGVILHSGTSQITVEECIVKAPVAENGGHRKIGFYTAGQLNLIQRCHTEDLRNDYVAGYGAPGPNAFVQCDSRRSASFSGAISSWAPGLLFDLVNIDGNSLSFKNLGQHNAGAGWNTANSMMWQCTAAELECYSPTADGINRAYGCWGQYSGNGEWFEADSHIQPRSLFYTQLKERLNRNSDEQAKLMPLNTNATSSPTIEQAAILTKEATKPVMTIERWINEQAVLTYKEDKLSRKKAKKPVAFQFNPKSTACSTGSQIPDFSIKDGKLMADNQLITGAKHDIQWWSGKTKPSFLTGNRSKAHITRFVPGHEGFGLTDRIDSVVNQLSRQGVAVLEHNYGLWYERRRDDHQRIRRADGNVWAPFYEQPFARSGKGTAWDGLTKYDLNRPNEWYWNRLSLFADKAAPKGMLLFHQMFFQHNILEAGAHWVDSPWRTANNINNTDFPEPVHFAGDKRIFYAEMFYDTTHQVRKELYRSYIREGLNRLSKHPNVVHLLSAEYTGPLHFMQFWLDVIREWEQETGLHPLIALSATKDVQDAILNDPVRAAVVDIIDIRYWHYRENDTVYAPAGGQNLAPRQHARLVKTGKTTAVEVFRAVNEYRLRYPDKVVFYYGQSYPQAAEAVLNAGGSLPVLRR